MFGMVTNKVIGGCRWRFDQADPDWAPSTYPFPATSRTGSGAHSPVLVEAWPSVCSDVLGRPSNLFDGDPWASSSAG